jgi:hypothetical protein
VRDLENRFIHETPALYHIGRVSGLRRTETLVIPAFFSGYFSSKEFNSFMSTSQHFYDLKFVQNLRYIKYEPFASVFPVFSFEFLVPLKLCGEVAPFYKKFQIETIFIPLSLLVMSC